MRLARQHRAELRVLHVVDGGLPETLAEAQRLEAERILAERVQAVAGEAKASIPAILAKGNPFAEVQRDATSWPADIIVIGTHQAGFL